MQRGKIKADYKKKESGQIFGFDKRAATKNLCQFKRSDPLFPEGFLMSVPLSVGFNCHQLCIYTSTLDLYTY